MQRSILGPILPEAMVCYLENYEPERFAQIFLGEFDTPEAIWSSEMRYFLYTYLISKTYCVFELFVSEPFVYSNQTNKLRKISFFSFKADDDRKNSITSSRFLPKVAQQHKGVVSVLSHTGYQLSTAGKRTVLQHLLPASSV